MSRVNSCYIALLGGLLTTAAGCVTNSAPEGFLALADETPGQAYGGWIEVWLPREEGQRRARREPAARGELLAVNADSLYVLSDSGFTAFALADLDEARLFGYTTGWHFLGLTTFLGAMSTLSHGWFLVLSAPVWIGGGSALTGSQSRAPLVRYPRHAWPRMRAYARFPQGLPPNLPRTDLHARPPG